MASPPEKVLLIDFKKFHDHDDVKIEKGKQRKIKKKKRKEKKRKG